ncbi:Phthiodiolone/phenolphthiodiolone dimycocerosates ketoreductase [Streptomyces sp. YIM 130001]|uniref:LLM class flavin-dependent oxidoreductase n=1 Tax=Streptomyces sp. YIM 130001 TaxID=2259644 RepID=UPI000E64F734|nr:LLM class flavin-dependent oxidoreductase [Streptomyces sp. YIM 130001]RII14693.1 Phthiodiolone/phenolphthiodiolone dimycocerosates ketoreductase [Streptomyces sp. YIM 130001]
MTALGAVFRPQLPPERLRDVALAADRAGLDELWLWEDCFLESGIASASAALAWTERLRVGVGLLPAPLRNVALTSMEAATLYRLFPGRVLLGVGHGVQDWMGQVGARVDSPVTLLREYLDAMRALLAGERVTTSGRYVQLDRVALDWPPLTPPPVLAGAIGPRSLRLTGESADGTVVDARVSAEGLRTACALVEEGRKAAGRTGPHPVTVYVHAATGPGAAERVEAEVRREGHDPSAGLGAAGDAAEIAAAVHALAEAGADTVVLQPTADEPDPEGFVRFAAEQVRPLVTL